MTNQSTATVVNADDGKFRAILAERARKLAQSPKIERKGETTELVILRVGLGKYGIPLAAVDAIEHLRSLTPVPGLPAYWTGLVNLRGRLLPVLELANYLGVVGKQEDEDEDASAAGSELVVVTSGLLTICLQVDGVEGVQTVYTDEITPALGATSINSSEIISGSIPGLIALLDVGKLLSDPALTVQNGMQ